MVHYYYYHYHYYYHYYHYVTVGSPLRGGDVTDYVVGYKRTELVHFFFYLLGVCLSLLSFQLDCTP